MNSSCIGGRYLTMKRAISLVSRLTTDLPRGGIWQENPFTVCCPYSSAEKFDILLTRSSNFDDHSIVGPEKSKIPCLYRIMNNGIYFYPTLFYKELGYVFYKPVSYRLYDMVVDL